MGKIFLPQTFRVVILAQVDIENCSLVSSCLIISIKTGKEADSQTHAILAIGKQKKEKKCHFIGKKTIILIYDAIFYWIIYIDKYYIVV